MKLDEIMEEWRADSKIDKTELGAESLRTPELHHKYYKLMIESARVKRSLDAEYKVLYRNKHQHYLGQLSEEEYKELGWTPSPLKILRQDLQIYIDADHDIQLLRNKIDIQDSKLSALENIIKTIANRGFAIKNAIDWNKFQMGA